MTSAAFRFVVRQIFRSPAKTALVITVSLLFILALSFLRESIRRSEAEIDRLYNTVPAIANIEQSDPNSYVDGMRIFIGNVISPDAVRRILESGLIVHEYLEAGHEWAIVLKETEDGSFPSDWQEIIGYNRWAEMIQNLGSMNYLFAFSDMDRFIAQHSLGVIDSFASRTFSDGAIITDDMRVEFAEGYDISSFVFDEDAPIPVILSENTMAQRGLKPGDRAYLSYTFYSRIAGWTQKPVIVIGTHNRNITGEGVGIRDSVLIPLDAMKSLMGIQIGYITVKFEIDPEKARELLSVKEQLQQLIGNAGWTKLSLNVQDEELRTVVGSVEQSLSLLRLLYPVVIALAVIIGFALSLLILLQNAKTAAIMRILGSTKRQSSIVLCFELALVSLAGALIGSFAAAALGWEIRPALSGLYLAGTIGGAITGALFVTVRPPLELLQVKE